MGIKPPDSDIISVHTYWDSSQGFTCPLCDHKLEFAFNDGGRSLITLKGPLWIITNYYRCRNFDCDLHKAFPMVHESMIKNKKFAKDVWERVIRYHFKYHMDYSEIQAILWDDSDVNISKTTIRKITQYFEKAGINYLDNKILEEIRANGHMIVSLDGAQPKKGKPALWIFTDRITHHTIHAELMDSATAEVLSQKLTDLQNIYGVPIKAVISDKQKNIVNAVIQFNPKIPHAFCQYHFLNHIMEPIQAKDSHIATQIRKSIRSLSIVANLPSAYLDPQHCGFNSHYQLFAPLAEELLNAVAVNGRKWDIMPGKEIFENISYIKQELDAIKCWNMPPMQSRSINTVFKQLEKLLSQYQSLYDEVIKLLADSADLRKELSRKRNTSKKVQMVVQTWVYRMQSRLKRRNLEYRPEHLKYQEMNYNTSLEDIWQQWIRLEWSYHKGLYYSYDFPEIEKTNNATEQLINRVKRHFKKWLGQQGFQQIFEQHGEDYSQLIELELTTAQIYEIMWKQSVVIIQGNRSKLTYVQPCLKRNWHIREKNTGNFERLRFNLENQKETEM